MLEGLEYILLYRCLYLSSTFFLFIFSVGVSRSFFYTPNIRSKFYSLYLLPFSKIFVAGSYFSFYGFYYFRARTQRLSWFHLYKCPLFLPIFL